MQRRQFLREITISVPLLTGAGSISACLPVVHGGRGFALSDAFEWTPREVFHDVAFSVLDRSFMPHLDASCTSCRRVVRAFDLLASVGAAMNFPCSHCRAGMLVGVTITRGLIAELRSYGIRVALGLPSALARYFVHEVGPAKVGSRVLTVDRATVSLEIDIGRKEPRQVIARQVPALPNKIVFYTRVLGAMGGEQIFHVWRLNGVVSDSIPLGVGAPSWRTWTVKRNLARGAWVATAETPQGHILAFRDWLIA